MLVDSYISAFSALFVSKNAISLVWMAILFAMVIAVLAKAVSSSVKDKPITEKRSPIDNPRNTGFQPRNIVPLCQPDASELRPCAYDGDSLVSHYLHKLGNSHYVVLDNLLLTSHKTASGMTQIDHVVVSTYGIFVIETKGHTGFIYGSKQNKSWTQYKNHDINARFHNPMWQNYGHVCTVWSVLGGWVAAPLQSMCIFPFASKLKVEGYSNVYKLEDAMRFIRSQNVEVYSNAQVNHIVDLLMRANRTDDVSHSYHVTKLQASLAV